MTTTTDASRTTDEAPALALDNATCALRDCTEIGPVGVFARAASA